MVEQFQGDEHCQVALLSIMAAGTGLNFSAASHVVFAELLWTPAVLVQAEDRAHRIGQQWPVLCHYILGKNTIDDLLWPLLAKKLTVVGQAISGDALHMDIDEMKHGSSFEADRAQGRITSFFQPHQHAHAAASTSAGHQRQQQQEPSPDYECDDLFVRPMYGTKKRKTGQGAAASTSVRAQAAAVEIIDDDIDELVDLTPQSTRSQTTATDSAKSARHSTPVSQRRCRASTSPANSSTTSSTVSPPATSRSQTKTSPLCSHSPPAPSSSSSPPPAQRRPQLTFPSLTDDESQNDVDDADAAAAAPPSAVSCTPEESQDGFPSRPRRRRKRILLSDDDEDENENGHEQGADGGMSDDLQSEQKSSASAPDADESEDNDESEGEYRPRCRRSAARNSKHRRSNARSKVAANEEAGDDGADDDDDDGDDVQPRRSRRARPSSIFSPEDSDELDPDEMEMMMTTVDSDNDDGDQNDDDDGDADGRSAKRIKPTICQLSSKTRDHNQINMEEPPDSVQVDALPGDGAERKGKVSSDQDDFL